MVLHYEKNVVSAYRMWFWNSIGGISMSMIGNFGMCAESDYNSLVAAVRNDQLDTADDWIGKICNELENSTAILENDQCSGEVFLAIFQYFKSEYAVDIYGNEDMRKLNERWREVTGDYDITVFTQKEKTQFLSLIDQIDYDHVMQYVDDFYQNDYGNAGQVACKVLFENLRRMKPDNVLLWHLC